MAGFDQVESQKRSVFGIVVFARVSWVMSTGVRGDFESLE
jgi:hypothetical protein